MHKKLKVVIYTIIILATILTGCFMFIKMNKFEVSSNDRYIVISQNGSYMPRSDGGSYTKVYYQIDLSKKVVRKCEDKYVGFKGFDYKEKVLNRKRLTNEEAQELKTILENEINNYSNDSTDVLSDCFVESYSWNELCTYTIVSYNHMDVNFSVYKDIERLTNLLE